MSVSEPQELAAAPRATSLVLMSSWCSRWSRSRRQQPGLKFTLGKEFSVWGKNALSESQKFRNLRTETPFSSAMRVQGVTLPSWSRFVTTTLSPKWEWELCYHYYFHCMFSTKLVTTTMHWNVCQLEMGIHLLVCRTQGPSYGSERRIWINITFDVSVSPGHMEGQCCHVGSKSDLKPALSSRNPGNLATTH